MRVKTWGCIVAFLQLCTCLCNQRLSEMLQHKGSVLWNVWRFIRALALSGFHYTAVVWLLHWASRCFINRFILTACNKVLTLFTVYCVSRDLTIAFLECAPVEQIFYSGYICTVSFNYFLFGWGEVKEAAQQQKVKQQTKVGWLTGKRLLVQEEKWCCCWFRVIKAGV